MPVNGLSTAQRRAFLGILALGDRTTNLIPGSGHAIPTASAAQLQEARFLISTRERLLQPYRLDDGPDPTVIYFPTVSENGQPFPGIPVGKPEAHDVYQFEYWLGGHDSASRKVSVELARLPGMSRPDTAPPK